MPLRKECNLEALSTNIASEIRAGRPQAQAVAIAHSTLRAACKEAGKPVPTRKATRGRTLEFLEGALARAREILNPRDYAVIFQAARASAGGQVAAKRRKERYAASVAEKLLIEKASHASLSDSEFRIAVDSLNKAYSSRKRADKNLDGVFKRAHAFMREAKKRELELQGPVYVELGKRMHKDPYAKVAKAVWTTAFINNLPDSSFAAVLSGGKKDDEGKTVPRALRKLPFKNPDGSVNKPHLRNALARLSQTNMPTNAKAKARRKLDAAAKQKLPTSEAATETTTKGFINTDPEGGMHAHGLDRRNGKSLNDGGHIHIWVLPGSGDIVFSVEDGFHEHALEGDSTARDGAHSHRVLLPDGESLETRLGGEHTHQLMVETSGFDGLHTHTLVLQDGAELESMTPEEFVEALGEAPPSGPLMSASAISGALHELMEKEVEESFENLLRLPNINEAVEMVLMGKTLQAPIFALECVDKDDLHIFLADASGRIVATEKNNIDAEIGDVFDVRDGQIIDFSKSVVPNSSESVDTSMDHWALIQRHTSQIPFIGPKDASLLFICTAPNELEIARKQALVGENALTFNDIYLKPLGLTKKDIAVGFAIPVLPSDNFDVSQCEKWKPHLVEALKSYPQAKVISLGKVAREVLAEGGIECWSLPHPSAVRKRGDSGEVGRKLKVISKTLDIKPLVVKNGNNRLSASSKESAPGKLTDAISEMQKTGHTKVRVVKSADEKQIVYGVVLDPYSVDLQNEWVPPAEIESTAHGFLKKSRVIGFEHIRKADAQIVESWVEPYPSQEDYRAALDNQPHKAYVRKFGDDEIHSGAWVAGVQVGDREWELHKQGKLNAFSVGGFSFKTKVLKTAMPEVEFISLRGAPT